MKNFWQETQVTIALPWVATQIKTFQSEPRHKRGWHIFEAVVGQIEAVQRGHGGIEGRRIN